MKNLEIIFIILLLGLGQSLFSQSQIGIIAGGHYLFPYEKSDGHFMPRFRNGTGLSFSLLYEKPLEEKINFTSALVYFKKSYWDLSGDGSLGGGIINNYRVIQSNISIDPGIEFTMGKKSNYQVGFGLSLGYNVSRREDGMKTIWFGSSLREEMVSGPATFDRGMTIRFFVSGGVNIPVRNNVDFLIYTGYSIGFTGANIMAYTIQLGYMYTIINSKGDPID